MSDIQKMIDIRQGYVEDLVWSIWYLDSHEVDSKKQKISTVKEIIKDIKAEIKSLKERRDEDEV
jgi:hypothetical protein